MQFDGIEEVFWFDGKWIAREGGEGMVIGTAFGSRFWAEFTFGAPGGNFLL